MRHLLNTLFVTSEDVYLSLDGENVVASRDKQTLARYPLHTLSGIISFSYSGASPALMGACAPVSYTHLDVYKRQLYTYQQQQLEPFLRQVQGIWILAPEAYDSNIGLSILKESLPFLEV